MLTLNEVDTCHLVFLQRMPESVYRRLTDEIQSAIFTRVIMESSEFFDIALTSNGELGLILKEGEKY